MRRLKFIGREHTLISFGEWEAKRRVEEDEVVEVKEKEIKRFLSNWFEEVKTPANKVIRRKTIKRKVNNLKKKIK